MMAQSYHHYYRKCRCGSRSGGKYAPITQSFSFIQIAVETTGAINSDGIEFLGDLGRCITRIIDDKRESAFLFQQPSLLIQRYNMVAIQGTFAHTTLEDEF